MFDARSIIKSRELAKILLFLHHGTYSRVLDGHCGHLGLSKRYVGYATSTADMHCSSGHASCVLFGCGRRRQLP